MSSLVLESLEVRKQAHTSRPVSSSSPLHGPRLAAVEVEDSNRFASKPQKIQSFPVAHYLLSSGAGLVGTR